MRYAGLQNNHICIVSDQEFSCANYSVVPLPNSLDNISNSELIAEYRLRDGYFISRRGPKQAKDLRVAFITNFGDECGIASYSYCLFNSLVNLIGDHRIFSEKNVSAIGSDKIVPCWKRGESTAELVAAIKKYDPDLVLLEHEYGLWPNARHFLSLLTQLSQYRCLVEMHSTFPNHQDKIIFEAACEEIIVHLQGAKDNLEVDKKLAAKIYLIPHGCYHIVNQAKLWDNYKTKQSFIQQGFGFQYKNFQDSIKATAILKQKYPNIFFTAIFSESPHNKLGHQNYYNELLSLIKELNIQENVAIIRGFQSDHVMDTYLRSNQAAVFPYLSVIRHEVFGSSGAARLAMAAGLPVISSSIPHFSDLPTIKADGAEQIAQALDQLFSNEELKQTQIKKQNQFVLDNSFAKMAERYVEIFEKGY